MTCSVGLFANDLVNLTTKNDSKIMSDKDVYSYDELFEDNDVNSLENTLGCNRDDLINFRNFLKDMQKVTKQDIKNDYLPHDNCSNMPDRVLFSKIKRIRGLFSWKQRKTFCNEAIAFCKSSSDEPRTVLFEILIEDCSFMVELGINRSECSKYHLD